MFCSNHDAWYVRASFGTEWGPISASTLLEMADSGSLARDDLARCERDSEWQPIPDVIDQLRSSMSAPENPALQGEASEELLTHDPLTEENLNAEEFATIDSSNFQTFDDVNAPVPVSPALPRKSRQGALPGWSNYWSPDASNSSSAQDSRFPFSSKQEPQFVDADSSTDELLGNDHGEADVEVESEAYGIEHYDQVDSVESRQNSELNNDQFSLLESWKQQRTDRLNRLLKIVADREERARAEKNSDDEARSANPTVDVSSTTEPDDSQVTGAAKSQPLIEVRQTVVRKESWEQTFTRWRRSLPDRTVVGVVLLMTCVAWWFWPESYGDVPETFRAMYDKLERLRELENDKTGMDDFVQVSQSRLAKIIPVLEKQSTPNRPESQWLLWMGRDCLAPMLKNPRLRDTKPEVTFRKLLAEWDRKFNLVVRPKNAGSTTMSPNADAEASETPQDATKPVNRAARQLKTAEESANDR
ncbi:MAG: DUF4339 domain-containing protein [Planctomycetia bacterium]|nr:DUF4339 domain-containing protein [Planctomycetia bacterium]